MNSYLNCYCTAGATSTFLFEKISRVQFGSIDNTSFSGTAGYEDFTALSTNALKGTLYTDNCYC
ncbi:MAG: hypothetical protein H6549_08820 [Chitinophagales bacterium]|nr:hypothetical protein [Chitinophagales bacterium]